MKLIDRLATKALELRLSVMPVPLFYHWRKCTVCNQSPITYKNRCAKHGAQVLLKDALATNHPLDEGWTE